jgi:hypothetical protein
MKNFVQLKDDVVFAYHQSSTEEDIAGDNIIQVELEGHNYLSKKYVNGDFVDAPIIRYAVIDEANENTIIEIKKTIFASEVGSNIIIDNENVKVLWKWTGSEFVAPTVIQPLPTVSIFGSNTTTTVNTPAITEEELEETSRLKQFAIDGYPQDPNAPGNQDPGNTE